MEHEFVFKLDCDPDAVTPIMLKQTVETFVAMLDDANASQWNISGLGLHSIQLAASPKVEDADTVESIKKLSDIASLAQEDTMIINGINEQSKSVTHLFDLVQMFGIPVIIAVGSKTNTFTLQTVARIEQTMQKQAKRNIITFGKVQGAVDKIILHDSHRSIGLKDEVTSKRIDIKFTKEFDTQVKQINVGTTIRVTGMLSNGRTSMQAETIHVINRDSKQPKSTIADLEGILDLDFTGGLSSVEFVSALRDNATVGGLA